METLQSIHLISSSYAEKIIDDRVPEGLFLCRDGKWWVAIDNSTNDAWTEEFTEKGEAINWLLRLDWEYDLEVSKRKDLYTKGDEEKRKELLKAVESSGKSYDEIMEFLRERRE